MKWLQFSSLDCQSKSLDCQSNDPTIYIIKKTNCDFVISKEIIRQISSKLGRAVELFFTHLHCRGKIIHKRNFKSGKLIRESGASMASEVVQHFLQLLHINDYNIVHKTELIQNLPSFILFCYSSYRFIFAPGLAVLQSGNFFRAPFCYFNRYYSIYMQAIIRSTCMFTQHFH